MQEVRDFPIPLPFPLADILLKEMVRVAQALGERTMYIHRMLLLMTLVVMIVNRMVLLYRLLQARISVNHPVYAQGV